ncbi:MAG: hypothetical protein HY709_09510 [Candidatus Latescibacteria bacterium]|nr:hypothetical protein [Candidatus Latescibacterota bacterium]
MYRKALTGGRCSHTVASGIVTLLMLVLWGCGQDGQPPARSQRPPGPYRYEAQFSKLALRGWELFPRQRWSVHENVLTVMGGEDPSAVTSGYPGGMETVGDVKVDVHTRWQEGATTSAYGVVCRWTNQGNYRFVINAGGSFAVLREGGVREMPPVRYLHDWTPHEAVRLKGENRLRTVFEGPRLTFTINATPVATVEDTTFSQGVVGLTVEGSQRVDFTSFIVEELPNR